MFSSIRPFILQLVIFNFTLELFNPQTDVVVAERNKKPDLCQTLDNQNPRNIRNIFPRISYLFMDDVVFVTQEFALEVFQTPKTTPLSSIRKKVQFKEFATKKPSNTFYTLIPEILDDKDKKREKKAEKQLNYYHDVSGKPHQQNFAACFYYIVNELWPYSENTHYGKVFIIYVLEGYEELVPFKYPTSWFEISTPKDNEILQKLANTKDRAKIYKVALDILKTSKDQQKIIFDFNQRNMRFVKDNFVKGPRLATQDNILTFEELQQFDIKIRQHCYFQVFPRNHDKPFQLHALGIFDVAMFMFSTEYSVINPCYYSRMKYQHLPLTTLFRVIDDGEPQRSIENIMKNIMKVDDLTPKMSNGQISRHPANCDNFQWQL